MTNAAKAYSGFLSMKKRGTPVNKFGLSSNITNNLLTSITLAILEKLALVHFCTDLTALGPYCDNFGSIFPSTALKHG